MTASQCVFLWIRLLFLVSASALKQSLCKLFPGHIPFFFIFVTSSRISCLLYFTTCWQWEGFAWRQCYRFCGLCIPRQIANGVCTIEQVKLAASVWFSEDERDAGFRFTYQPGLVSSQRVVEMCRTEHLVEADLGDWEESFNQNLYFLLCFLPSLVENDQCHTG